MSGLQDELEAAYRPVVDEVARMVDNKITAATAPLVARIGELEHQVAELQAVATVIVNAYGSRPERPPAPG